MPGERENRQNTTGRHGFRGRWWNTLAFRLGVVVTRVGRCSITEPSFRTARCRSGLE